MNLSILDYLSKLNIQLNIHSHPFSVHVRASMGMCSLTTVTLIPSRVGVLVSKVKTGALMEISQISAHTLHFL